MQPFIGMLQAFGFDFAPLNWAKCAGQLIAIQQNTALFSLLGTAYGGDGRTTFALPDLQGRGPLGDGQALGGGGRTWRQGDKGGVESIVLSQLNLPSHDHIATFQEASAPFEFKASTTAGTATTPAADSFVASGGLGSTDALYVPGGSPGQTVPLSGGSFSQNGSVTVMNDGGSQPVSILQPLLTVNWSIAEQGLFPSRG
jgi:microcystin-dependent protein